MARSLLQGARVTAPDRNPKLRDLFRSVVGTFWTRIPRGETRMTIDLLRRLSSSTFAALFAVAIAAGCSENQGPVTPSGTGGDGGPCRPARSAAPATSAQEVVAVSPRRAERTRRLLLSFPAAVRLHRRRRPSRRPRSAAARCASSPTGTRPSPPIPIAIASTSSTSRATTVAAAGPSALNAGDEPGRVVEDGAGRVHVALRRGGALVSIDPVDGRRSSRAAPSARRRVASRTTRRPTSCTSRAPAASWSACRPPAAAPSGP